MAGICYIGRVKGGPDFNSGFDKKCISVKSFIKEKEDTEMGDTDLVVDFSGVIFRGNVFQDDMDSLPFH